MTAPFSSTDARIASGIAGVTLVLVASILLSAERVKRDSAESIVASIAAANRKRIAAGKPAVTGRVDDSSVLVMEGEIEPQEWDALPYVFTGAENARDACILAQATRRMDGPGGAPKRPYSRWGVCATAKGEVEPFEGACGLDCKEPAPPPPPVAEPVVRQPTPPPRPLPTRAKTIVVDSPDLGPEQPTQRTGCSVTGCFGTTCCDALIDRCANCPGASCCEKGLGCGGTCQEDEDCTIGCHCVKLAGSPWGNCRGK